MPDDCCDGVLSALRKLYHYREVFWHPTWMVERVGDQARENKFLESVSRKGLIT